jgi:hypothetical protein
MLTKLAVDSFALVPTTILRLHPKANRWKPFRSTDNRSYDGLKEDLQHKLKHEDIINEEKKNYDEKMFNREEHIKEPSLMLHFLRSFWKGMSLPFPVLRNVVLPQAFRQIKFGRATDSSTFTVGLSFREGLYALIVYLVMGVTAYSFILEKWSIVDSLYFTCACFSTGESRETDMELFGTKRLFLSR